MDIKTVLLVLASFNLSAGQFLNEHDLGNNSYLNARYLNHTTGRFLTQDTVKQFNSHYIYGSGNVIMSSDPSGMMWDPEYPWGSKGLMGHYNSDNPAASVDKAVKRMASNAGRGSKSALSSVKETVSRLVIKPIASGVTKVVKAVTPDISISGEFSIDMYDTDTGESYKGRHKDMGIPQDSQNMREAKALFSMRSTIERKVRYEMKTNGHYAGSEQSYENHVHINTSNDMDNYIRIRNKKYKGIATRSESSQLRKYHGDLLENDSYTREAITNLGKINRMSYWDMNEKLVGLYAEGPWIED